MSTCEALRMLCVHLPSLQLRDTALSYVNCNSSPVFGNAFAQLRVISRYRSLLNRCSGQDVRNDRFTSSAGNEVPFLLTRQCCQSVGHCDACLSYQPQHPLSIHACRQIQTSSMSGGGSGLDFVGCEDSTSNYNTAEFVSRCCFDANQSQLLNWTVADYLDVWRRKAERQSTLFHDSSADSFVQTDALRRFCRRSQQIVDDIRDGTRLSDANYRPSTDFVGLGCRTNRSVQFYAMDRQSLYGSAFLRSVFGNRLGATLLSDVLAGKSGQSAVAVVDINVSYLYICHYFSLL